MPFAAFAAAPSAVEATGLITVFLIALGLSADCFAVSISVSLARTRPGRGPVIRTALAFGLGQALMPVLGWLAGRSLAGIISGYDHWVAFGLLSFIGGKMLWESFHEKEEKSGSLDVMRNLTLLTLAVATSIDALGVGLSFALMQVNIWLAAGVIGAVAATVTGLGFLTGQKAGPFLGRWAETVGGLVLIGIGIKILVEHLFE